MLTLCLPGDGTHRLEYEKLAAFFRSERLLYDLRNIGDTFDGKTFLDQEHSRKPIYSRSIGGSAFQCRFRQALSVPQLILTRQLISSLCGVHLESKNLD